jgi:protein-disulfide isomerase
MNARLLAHQDALARSDLERYAADLGLEPRAFAAALDAGKHTREIELDSESGLRIGAVGTPTLFVNGRVVHGALEDDALEQLVAEELQHADTLLRQGTPRTRLYDRILSRALRRAPAEGEDPPDPKVYAIDTKGAPTRGTARAPVTIVEFGDFQCPFCGRAEATLDELRRRYGDKIRIVWKDNPMPFHQQAVVAAEAARAAGDQGQFWPMHDRLLAKGGQLDLGTIEAEAEGLGLDMERFRKTLDSGAHRQEIERDLGAARSLGLDATPTFFVAGRKLVGAAALDRFRVLVDSALGR